MFIAAILVGLLTAYYVEIRAGLYAAGVAIALFVAADMFPAMTVAIYVLTGVWVCGVCWIGPTLGRHKANEKILKRIIGLAIRKWKLW